MAEVLESWWPARLDPEDAAAVHLVMHVVRVWVAAAAPATTKTARVLLWAVTRLAVWAYLNLGSLDEAIVLDPHNVQHFTMHVNANESPAWQHAMRSALTRVGRAANPQGWTPAPPQAGRIAPADPYAPDQELGFIREARMPGRPHRPARMFVVGASAGMGMPGPEIRRARVEDLVDLRRDRVGLRIEGRNVRLVPVRAMYTAVIRDAAEATGTGKFIVAEGYNAVHSIAERLTTDGPVVAARTQHVARSASWFGDSVGGAASLGGSGVYEHPRCAAFSCGRSPYPRAGSRVGDGAMSTSKARVTTASSGVLTPPTRKQRRHLSKTRCLPHDFKDKSKEPLPSSKKLGRKMLDIVRNSGAADIDRLLRGSRGSKPIVSYEALLVAILLGGRPGGVVGFGVEPRC